VVGEALLPLIDLDVQLANGTDSRVGGFGDLIVGSGLQWAPIGLASLVGILRALGMRSSVHATSAAATVVVITVLQLAALRLSLLPAIAHR
jgi:hypothetical protein